MTEAEKRILDVIYNCGGITKKGIEKLSGDEVLIKTLLDKKVLKKQPISMDNKKIALYTISDVGERYYWEQTGKKHFFRCGRPEKIVALSYYYISEIENCIDWVNKDEWYANGETDFVPDGTYISNGDAYGIIVIRSTDQSRTQEKLSSFIESHNIRQIKIISR